MIKMVPDQKKTTTTSATMTTLAKTAAAEDEVEVSWFVWCDGRSAVGDNILSPPTAVWADRPRRTSAKPG